MKRQLILLLTILITACGQNSHSGDKMSAETKSGAENSNLSFSVTNACFDDFSKAVRAYKDKFIPDTTVIKKTNRVLKIPLVQPHYPPSITFTDTLEDVGETDERTYKYLGQFKELGVYLVEGVFWEHYECYLIDKKTGWKTTVWNKPKLSPSSKYFANLSMSYGLEGVPNGIQIWKIAVAGQELISKYFELDQQIWVPYDFIWETDNSLILKVASVDKFWSANGEVNDKDFSYLRIKLK
jgi:hypothetical protein